jgi:hypothetical protein
MQAQDPDADAPRSIEAILSEDPKATAKEVWLLDTGEWLVWDDVHPAWKASLAWRRAMRLRRSLRMFVPLSEIPKLRGIQSAFSVAKRGYEIVDALGRHRELSEELAGLRSAGADEDAINAQAARVTGTFQSAAAHAALVSASVPEASAAIRTLPYRAPRIEWKEPAQGKGGGTAGNDRKAEGGKPGKVKPDKGAAATPAAESGTGNPHP